jgi:DNA polymerase III alpha subunit (gram-positive type)
MQSMTPTYHSGFVHLNGNLLVAVDVETTGLTPGWHEIIQIAIQPLNSQVRPLEGVLPFYQHMKPEHPERASKKAMSVNKLDLDWLMVHAPDRWKTAELLDEWWISLKLPFLKTLVPLAQNWQYEAGFLKAWLGLEQFSEFFHSFARDTMLTAIYMNDRAYINGESIPFPRLALAALCKHYNIVNTNPHDALADAIAEAELYRHQVMEDGL